MKALRLLVVPLVFLALILGAVNPIPQFPPPTVDAAAGGDGDRVLVKFRDGVPASERTAAHRQVGGNPISIISGIDVAVVEVPQGKGHGAATAYLKTKKVKYAEVDHQVQLEGSVNDTYFIDGFQRNMQRVQAPEAWDVTAGSTNVSIAILDSGMELSHPDLANKIKESVNFTSSGTVSDVYGHGTHVAGIAAAATNNSEGVAGLGYNSKLFNVKVAGDTGLASYSSVAQGIIWATDHGAQVINMSLAGAAPSPTWEDALKYAWGKGVVLVAAAGNSASSDPVYPAYYPNVIAVASTESNDQLSPFSNYGDWVDVGAPGGNIWSTRVNNSYGNMAGTSMATPHVAGLAALVATTVSDVDSDGFINDEIRSCILANADDVGVSGIGSGRINAFKSVQCSPVVSTGIISGQVESALDGTPVEAATVSDGERLTFSDNTGAFRLNDVPEGNHTLTVSKAGYDSASQVVTVTANRTATAIFTLDSSAPPPSVDEPVWVSGISFIEDNRGKDLSIRVRVVDEAGAIAGANVQMRVTRNGAQAWQFNGYTDSSGVATFTLTNPSKRGTFQAQMTGLSASGYTWDTSKGVTTASYSR